MNGPSNFTGLAVSIVLFSGYVLCGSPSLDNVTKLFRGLDFVTDARRTESRTQHSLKISQNVKKISHLPFTTPPWEVREF